MSASESFALAAVQAASIFFDRDASCEKACRLIQEAADKGADLAAFGECWLPGYPFLVKFSARSALDSAAADAREAYIESAVEIPARQQTGCARRQQTPASMW